MRQPTTRTPPTRTPPTRTPRIYYGWYILAITMTAAFFAAGTSQLFMSVMLKPITEDMGWSRTTVAGAVTAGTVTSGFLAVIGGRLADRYGPRVLVTVGVLIVGGAYFAMSNATLVIYFYLSYVVGRGMAQATLGGVVGQTAVVNWFRRMRGRAIGMFQMSIPLGASFLALMAGIMMDQGVHWRTVFAVFGVLTLAVVLLPAAIWLRRRPEDIGLLPDGDRPAAEPGAGRGMPQPQVSTASIAPEESWSLREALRTRAMWFLIFAIAFSAFATSGVTFHTVAYLTDKALATTVAVGVLSVYGLSGAVANGMWGFAVERYSERLLAVIAMAISGVMVLFLLAVNTGALAFIFAVLFGLAARGEASLLMMIIARYFGRDSFGAITGFTNPFQMVGLGLGPLVSALAFDVTGSYTGVFLGMASTFMVTAAVLWAARKPTRGAAAITGSHR